MRAGVDLNAYLQRIDYAGHPLADLASLRQLHLKHPIAIPFENLATLIGEPVSLDIAAIQDKLVRRGRGGYCFEHNRLFCSVLEQLGFDVQPLAARVTWQRSDPTAGARTHMLLLVRLQSDTYISDVGFGGLTLTAPLKLETDRVQATPHEQFRITAKDGEFEVEARLDSDWKSLYRFDLQPQQPVDFEVLNHYVATHPDSHFLTTLMAARRIPNGLHTLHNASWRTYGRGRLVESGVIESVAALRSALSELFTIPVPSGARLDAALQRVLQA